LGDTAVVTRGTLKPLPSQQGDCFAGAAISLDQKRYVIFSLRPICCGYIGDPADKQRIAEMQQLRDRIMDLRSGTLGTDFTDWKDAPVVLFGDWNLVGSRTPLDLMEDKKGPALVHSIIRHLNSPHAYTWIGQDTPGEFPPGILDLLAHSPSLEFMSGFVLDTADLNADTLSKLKLQKEDSRVSDHLLIVADLHAL
jgi:hypothetical protein